MTKKQKAKIVAERLEKLYPQALCSLDYQNDAFRLLVMSRLSAQCTDERVNAVSKTLFEKFPDAKSFAEADIADIEKAVFSCGLYHTKARDIRKMAGQLLEHFDGTVPQDMHDLLSLAGVGRKIANLIRGDLFSLGGIVSDTHCIRISYRLGLTDSKVPLKNERQLEKLVPQDMQSDFCHRLVLFGRDTCAAKNPRCDTCPMADVCGKHME